MRVSNCGSLEKSAFRITLYAPQSRDSLALGSLQELCSFHQPIWDNIGVNRPFQPNPLARRQTLRCLIARLC
jgi:hypothetical protein